MIYIVIGNIIALIASVLMVYSGILREKKKIIYVQTIQIGLSVISNLVLGGITGAIINALSCIRNILCYKDKLGTKEKTIIIILSIILSLIFNNIGFIGILPVISTVAYILLMNTKNVIKFKILIIVTMIMWLIYDLYIKSYTSAIFDFMNIVANIISIFQLRVKK
jgi:hypothetical protein